MGRKSKVSTEIKLKAINDYEKGQGSFATIARSLGVGSTTVRTWYYKYKRLGNEVFTSSSKNKTYTKVFKLKIISLYDEGYSIMDLASSYNLSLSMVSNWVNKYNSGVEILDYIPNPEVYAMKSKKLTLEEKIEIVEYVLKNKNDYKGAAAKYSANYSSVYSWVQKYKTDGIDGLKNQKRGR